MKTIAPILPCDTCKHCKSGFLLICKKGYSIAHFMGADYGEKVDCSEWRKDEVYPKTNKKD